MVYRKELPRWDRFKFSPQIRPEKDIWMTWLDIKWELERPYRLWEKINEKEKEISKRLMDS